MTGQAAFREGMIQLGNPGWQNELATRVAADGFATFEHVHSRDTFLQIGQVLGEVALHEEADKHGITEVKPKSGDLSGSSRFTEGPLVWHTDGNALVEPPKFIGLYCVVPATRGGGDSRILDGMRVFNALSEERPDLLDKLRLPFVATFGRPSHPPYKGPVFYSHPDGLVSIRFRGDKATRYHGLSEAAFSDLLDIMQELEVRFRLAEGQGFVLNNRRVVHGRYSFKGERLVRQAQWTDDPARRLGHQIEAGFRV